jgi:hypothetical protein
MEPDFSRTETASTPPEWGCDALSRSLELAHENALRTFAVEDRRVVPLIEVDDIFRQLVDDLGSRPEPLSGGMLMRTHSHFLGAVSMTLGGRVAEAYALLNRSLKTAMQGVFISGHPERQQLWINRHNDEASRREMQTEFKARRIRRHLQRIDAASAKICDKLLLRTLERIDHSNVYDGATASPAREVGEARVGREYFVQGGEVQRSCLRTAAQVGICCLCLFYYVFADHYRNSGIPKRLTALRQGH